MSQKTDPSDEISPFAYLGSTLGNAYFSGVGMELLFEAVCATYDERDNLLCPQIRVEVKRFERLDKTVNAAISAKEWLDKVVLQHGNS